jgi:hypothetical protein
VSTALPVLFALLAVTVGACAISARGPWVRAAAFSVSLGVSAALWQLSLGLPRPVLLAAPTGTVVSYHLDEPRAIYLWVTPPRGTVPASLKLPWSERQAAQLQEAAEQAKKRGQPLQVGAIPGRTGLTSQARGEVRFYARQPPPLPPKTIPNS